MTFLGTAGIKCVTLLMHLIGLLIQQSLVTGQNPRLITVRDAFRFVRFAAVPWCVSVLSASLVEEALVRTLFERKDKTTH